MIRRLYDIEAKAKKAELSDSALSQLRQRESKPILDRLSDQWHVSRIGLIQGRIVECQHPLIEPNQRLGFFPEGLGIGLEPGASKRV